MKADLIYIGICLTTNINRKLYLSYCYYVEKFIHKSMALLRKVV